MVIAASAIVRDSCPPNKLLATHCSGIAAWYSIYHMILAPGMLCALVADARMRRAGAGCARPRWSGAACLMQWRRRPR